MKQYLEFTRSPWYSYWFSVPLLLLYQLAVVLSSAGQSYTVVNGADALIQRALAVMGVRGWLASWLLLAVVLGGWAYFADPAHRKGPFQGRFFGWLLAETAVYALLLGFVVRYLTGLILSSAGLLQIGGGKLNIGQQLTMSLGAGLYEELVFRLFLTGMLLWFFRGVGMKEMVAVTGAVVAASLLFSLAHYVGPFGDTLRLTSFTFRFVAGLVLTTLFAVRGFAVAAWSHALYDVILVLFGQG